MRAFCTAVSFVDRILIVQGSITSDRREYGVGMWAVVALIFASAIAAGVTLPLASERPPPRDLPWDLAENAGKMVTIAGGLAAFTINGVVLILSFAQRPGAIGTPLSSAVGMFLVAFMSLVTSALMYGNLTRSGIVSSGVDIQSLQYSITTMMFFRSIFLGLLALRPLVEAYGLDDLADQIGWLILVIAVLGGWTMSVAVLYRLALVRARAAVFVPLLALAGCGVVALLFLWIRDIRSNASALYLAYALFALNALSFISYAVIPAALEHARLGPAIARSWGTGMAVVAVVSSMTIGFIWLATAGLL
jgi:hypothetical protein